ncbi:uncharacterized protein PV09_00738 [Verruconis gallopava]|uniref:Uncharacterized protein n=1 Tax=Verruconis gallopava TaxID=253628 RepID=A0A0D2BBQ1_9PEZI|nr:uncharacterized protein PV09_00738 [Verruconis gallopava]KIW08804.1 hypothetical protein PV09_00738 [Verruconis gallopava]
MANAAQLAQVTPGDILLVVHDFNARSPDELSLKRGDKIELIEKDDDFGDGWFLGRHLSRDDSGLFPAVYTTPAPKPTSGAGRRVSVQQATSGTGQPIAELMGDEHLRAPSVQPPGSESNHATVLQSGTERSFSAPHASSNMSSSGAGIRPTAASVAQRSISLSNGAHQNSPVMNETLSVIEEHITDMSTPRHSLLTPEPSVMQEEDRTELQTRLSFINGHETDEEESAALTADEVLRWDPERVSEYLEDMGVDPQQCRVFLEQEITGEVLLGMDQGSLMLKEFELGSIGKRLALWQKIKAIQEEVKTGVTLRRGSGGYGGSGSPANGVRNRSTSVGLPRIPSLMERRTPSRQNSLQRSPTKQHAKHNESTASMPTMEAHHGGHTPRPSAASIRSMNHSRRHSSLDQAMASPSRLPAESPTIHKHTKQGSFDQGWTMGAPSSSTQGTPKDIPSGVQSPDPSSELPTPGEHGMLVVNSLDLDRGYFSGNEVDNRDRQNKLRKRQDLHGRAPSDGFGTRRLSAVFRSRRAGSTDSLDKLSEPSPAQLFYGKTSLSSGRSPMLSPGAGHRKHSSVSPTVTKLEYGDSPSIDAVANSPHVPGSETSSIERTSASKNILNRTRATGLKAISDAITGEEKKSAVPPTSASSEKGSFPAKESPMQSPGSSSPSVHSKSFEGTEESLLLKTSTSGSGGRHQAPLLPRRKGKKSTSAYTRGLEKKTPKEAMADCDYSGWMKKKSSNLMTTWKTRLFVLRGTRLSYYYAEEDTEEKGLIDISFHRVLPANNDRILGLHATFTGASASPTSPQNAQIETAAAQDAQKAGPLMKGEDSGMFIFKLVPPRAGLSKAVNFTKPTVHYFAVDNIQQGRLWMAALMKATIERDESHQVITTYKEKTISLAKARAMRQRPPALMGDSDEEKNKGKDLEQTGLRISYSVGDTDTATVTTNGDKDSSFTAAESVNPSTENVDHTSIPLSS